MLVINSGKTGANQLLAIAKRLNSRVAYRARFRFFQARRALLFLIPVLDFQPNGVAAFSLARHRGVHNKNPIARSESGFEPSDSYFLIWTDVSIF
jgi:hypothetical protein